MAASLMSLSTSRPLGSRNDLARRSAISTVQPSIRKGCRGDKYLGFLKIMPTCLLASEAWSDCCLATTKDSRNRECRMHLIITLATMLWSQYSPNVRGPNSAVWFSRRSHPLRFGHIAKLEISSTCRCCSYWTNSCLCTAETYVGSSSRSCR